MSELPFEPVETVDPFENAPVHKLSPNEPSGVIPQPEGTETNSQKVGSVLGGVAIAGAGILAGATEAVAEQAQQEAARQAELAEVRKAVAQEIRKNQAPQTPSEPTAIGKTAQSLAKAA